MPFQWDDPLQWWLSSSCPLAGLPSLRALQYLASYALLVALLSQVVPGRTVLGTTLPDGTRLRYTCNGFGVALVCVGLLLGSWRLEMVSLSAIADVAGELFSTTLVVSILLASWLLFSGTTSTASSSSLKPRFHGSFLGNFWLGTQLNPCWLGVDLKWFCLRLGMLGWLLLNLGAAGKQVQQLGHMTAAMTLFQVFSGFYVLDFFWHEECMTSTWDIIAECFGFMLVFGDLVWIPYSFSLQAWWLLGHDQALSTPYLILSAAVFVAGYCVFRGSNSQKHHFKRDPSRPVWGAPPRLVGGKLLASGYWGLARHCNYLGDLLVALAFSLPCGFVSALPYFYPVYLFVLLINRERRDEARCREKYKEVWVEYCRVVPWRICPFLY